MSNLSQNNHLFDSTACSQKRGKREKRSEERGIRCPFSRVSALAAFHRATPWTPAIRRLPLALPLRPWGIMACIHRCRNATRSTVHESGATPSLTTSRHLRSTPQISLCLVCTYIQSTHPRAQASLSNGILQTNIPTYMHTYMHTYITQRWCALAAGLRRNTGYNSLSVCCTARHESSEQEQL